MHRILRISTSTTHIKDTRRFSSEFTSLDRFFRFKPALLDDGTEEVGDGMMEQEEFVDESNGPNPSFRLGKNLMKHGKVHYRHIHPIPQWFSNRQEEISKHRTPAQIRRCLKSWMLEYDRTVQHKYRIRELGWRNESAESSSTAIKDVRIYGPEDTVAYAHYHMPSRFAIIKRVFDDMKMLLPSYEPRRVLDFGCGPGTAGAAAMHVWGNTNVVEKPDDLIRNPRELKLKAKNSIHLGSIQKYSGVDMSQAMLDAAKIMMTDSGADCVFWDKIGDVLSRAESRNERFDLAIAAYTLSELTSDAAKQAATQILFEMLDVGGCLVIIEAGSPEGSHTARSARQFVLDMFNKKSSPIDGKNQSLASHKQHKVKDDKKLASSGQTTVEKILSPPGDGLSHDDFVANVIAPCTHDKPCPLATGVWCSFSQKVHSGMIRVGSEEKFSYVVIQKRHLPPEGKRAISSMQKPPASSSSAAAVHKSSHGNDNWTTNHTSANPLPVALRGPQPQPTPREVLLRFLAVGNDDFMPRDVTKLADDLVDEVDWEEYNPPLYRQEWARVLRSPIKGKGHVTLDLCTPLGSVTRTILSRSNTVNIPTLFTALRKTTWGGLFPSDHNTSDHGGEGHGDGQDEDDEEGGRQGHLEHERSPLAIRSKSRANPTDHKFTKKPADSSVPVTAGTGKMNARASLKHASDADHHMNDFSSQGRYESRRLAPRDNATKIIKNSKSQPEESFVEGYVNQQVAGAAGEEVNVSRSARRKAALNMTLRRRQRNTNTTPTDDDDE